MSTNPTPPDPAEIKTKLVRLGEFLQRHRLDGVLLTHRPNFAWITGGKNNYIANNSPNGVASILATPDSRICFTNSIEAPRFMQEELLDTGIETVSYNWHDPAAGQRMLKELIAGRRIAADSTDTGEFDRFGAGLFQLPRDFSQLRWALTPAEIDRYRDGGRRTATAIEHACRKVEPNMTEHEIAGILDRCVRDQGLLPVVTLVAVDDRIRKFRHPIPTRQRLHEYAMLVTCASFAGLISNVTRFVSFVPLTDDLKRRQHAVCQVDAAVNLSTRPGKTLGEMFAVLQHAYAQNGFPREEDLHHQGGSTGYAGREAFAEPHMSIKVMENQAFAWNPSITGVKSEDTILCTRDGIEVLTAASSAWPRIEAHHHTQTLFRPDILVR